MKSLITAIESSLDKIENGTIELKELELMVNQSRELYERLVVLRYKVYADSVLGTNTPLIDEIKEEISFPVGVAAQEKEIEAAPFDFSLFDESSEEVESEEKIEEISEQTIESPISFAKPTERIQPEIEISNEEETIEIAEIPKTYVSEVPVSLFDKDITNSSESVQPAVEIEKKLVPVSNFEEVKFPTPVFANAPIEKVEVVAPVQEIISEPITPIVETPVTYATPIVEKETTYFSMGEEHPLTGKLKKIETNVRQNYSIVPLDTLIGSFTLNEKLQLINELFGGSSDEFSSSIKRLDVQGNLTGARAILAQMAEAQRWDLESETTEEFILKICRRYANNLSN